VARAGPPHRAARRRRAPRVM